MKPTSTFFTLFIGIVGIGVLIYLANYGVSVQAVPSLDQFIASSTQKTEVRDETPATSGMDAGQATSTAEYSVLSTPISSFRVQTATTSAARERGLSGRESLESDEGLLFVFPTPGLYGFWMKDMNFPIDIVWIDSSQKVVGIAENISPDSYPENFLPPRAIQFVLELNAGMAKKSGLATGTIVSF